MSAFIFGLIVVVGVGVIGLVGGGAYWLMRAVGLHVPPSLLAGNVLGDIVVDVMTRALEEQSIRKMYDRAVRSLLAMALAAGAINLLVWAISGAPRDLNKALRPFWYETGLNVSDDSGVAAACKGAHVAWLGASAAVLECRDRVHVIHKLDDLRTERRFGETSRSKPPEPPASPVKPRTAPPPKPPLTSETTPKPVAIRQEPRIAKAAPTQGAVDGERR